MALVNHRSPLESIPTAQVIAQIFALEAWLVDLATNSPGAVIAGLEPIEVDRLARRRLSSLRLELRRREGLEVGR